MTTITEPGVYYDLAAKDYHAQHDWLSWSRMKALLPPSTPAHFKAAMAAGEVNKRHFDLGKVVHTLVLGDGDEFSIVQAQRRDKTFYDATDYVTKSAQESRDAIYAAGKVPILARELVDAQSMAAAIKAHKVANALLSNGRPEVSLFWIDETTGVKCRARLDWLPDTIGKGRLIVPDLKTAVSAAPTEFAKSAATYGYYGQQAHYLDGIRATGLHDNPEFVFVTVEKTDPFLVSVGRFADIADVQLAQAAVEHCRRLYADCIKTDTWPGYPAGITDLELPMWLHWQMEDIAGTPASQEVELKLA